MYTCVDKAHVQEMGETKAKHQRESGKLRTRPDSVTGSTDKEHLEYEVFMDVEAEVQTNEFQHGTAASSHAEDDALNMLKDITPTNHQNPKDKTIPITVTVTITITITATTTPTRTQQYHRCLKKYGHVLSDAEGQCIIIDVAVHVHTHHRYMYVNRVCVQ